MEGLKGTPYERIPPRVPPTEVERVEQRRSRRLSKPRTTSSGKGALKPNLSVGDLSLLTGSVTGSRADLIAVASPTTEGPDPLKTPYCPDGPATIRNEKRRDGDEIAKSSRLHRTGTKIARKITVRRSFNGKIVNGADEAELAIEGYEWIKAKAVQDRLAMKSHKCRPTSKDADDDMAPIRRKSLLTPGLATRGNDILRKPPILTAQVDVQARYYNPNLSSMSPLARIASLEAPDRAGRTSHDTTRATTPADLDYGRIGGLRIANGGAVSPALTMLSLIKHPAQSSTPNLERFETTSEGGWSDAQTVSIDNSPLLNTDMDSPDIVALVIDTYANDVGNPWLDEDQDTVGELELGLAAQRTKQNQSFDLRRWPTVTSAYSQSDYGTVQPSEYAESHVQQLCGVETSSAERYTDYFEERHGPSRPESSFEPTSRMNEEDAMLFEEDLQVVSPLAEITPTLKDKVQKDDPSRESTQIAMSKILSSMRAASRFTPVPQRENEMLDYRSQPHSPTSDRPPLSATDSGYVSSTSYQSYSQGISPASSVSRTTMSSQTSMRPAGPRAQPQPSFDYFPRSAQQVTEFRPADIGALSRSETSRPHSETPTACSPEPRSPTHEFPEQLAPPVQPPQESIRQASPTGKKLQKRPPRAKSMPAPVDRIVITTCTEPDMSIGIPSIPPHMVARNAERWTYQSREDVLASSVTAVGNAHATQFDNYPATDLAINSLKDLTPRQSPMDLPPPVPPKDERRHRLTRSEFANTLDVARTKKQLHEPTAEVQTDTYPRTRPQPLSLTTDGQQLGSEWQRRPATTTVATFAQAEAQKSGHQPVDWVKYRQAWADRRKSAGQALKQRPDLESIASASVPAIDRNQGHQRSRTDVGYIQQSSLVDIRQRVRQFDLTNASRHPHADHSPSKPHKQDSYFQSGRYNGGLAFGYEPGKGIGGSAGTRGSNNAPASRKGGHENLARGFGVDLSDVPIFISRG